MTIVLIVPHPAEEPSSRTCRLPALSQSTILLQCGTELQSPCGLPLARRARTLLPFMLRLLAGPNARQASNVSASQSASGRLPHRRCPFQHAMAPHTGRLLPTDAINSWFTRHCTPKGGETQRPGEADSLCHSPFPSFLHVCTPSGKGLVLQCWLSKRVAPQHDQHK